MGRLDQSARVLGRERDGAGLRPGLRAEFLHPEPLGPPIGHKIVGPMPAVSRAQADRLPAARLVAGAAVALRIGEALGQKRRVAKLLLPLRGQRPAGRGQSLAGQIRLPAFFVQQQIPAILDDELEPLGGQRRIPADPFFAILELERRRPQTSSATHCPSRTTTWRRKSPTGGAVPR